MPPLYRLRPVLLAALLITPFATGRAQEKSLDPRTTTALRFAPADAAIFSTSLHLKDRVQRVWNTKAIQEAWNTPLVQAGWDEVRKKWDAEGGPVREMLKQKENQELLQLLTDMASEEMFVVCGAKTPRLVGVLVKCLGSLQAGRLGDIFGVDPDARPRELLRELRDNRQDLVVPEIVLGFKIKDPKVAVRQVARLELLLAAGALAVPKTPAQVRHQKINGFDFGTVVVDGAKLPWDQIPWDKFEEENGEFTPLLEHLKKMKLTVCVGTYENYVIFALGESTAVVESLGKGTKLADRPELAPLQKHLDKRLHSLSYFSSAMTSVSGSTREEAHKDLKSLLQQLEESDLKDEQKKRIAKDLEELVDDYYKVFSSQPGPSVTVSFGTPRGEETYQYHYAVDRGTDYSKPLSLLNHAGGSPVAVFVGRATPRPGAWDMFVKWCKKGEAYFRELALPQLPDEVRDDVSKTLEGLYPLFKRFDKTTRENLLPALVDGQAGLVIDNKLRSKEWHRSMPSAKEPLPIFEPAIVLGVSDPVKLQKAMADYRAIVNDAIKIIRENIAELPIPEEFAWPPPQVMKAGDATLYYYAFPDELQLDGRLTPTGAVGRNLAALTVSNEHAQRLLPPRSLQVNGGPLADLNRPLGGAAYFKMSALLDTAMPWVDYVLEQPDVKEHAQKHAADIKKILASLRIFDQYSSATYLEGNVTVTHSEWVIKDVK